ncbi:MAG: 5'-nucleotidase C-terminal domain-containing protein [Hellea sp.]
MINFSRSIILFSFSLAIGGNALAQTPPGCESSVMVQPGDTLSKIASRHYGDRSDYRRIFDATNAAAAVDSVYTRIENINRIKPGWTLCLPGSGSASIVVQPSIPSQGSRSTVPADTTRITFLQINDVYEMTPVGGEGGVARLSTLMQRLEAKNPNTYSVLSGDMFSPSALGTAKVDGQRLAGKQMVAAMNAFGLDFATFGNHEFDIKEDQFRQRMEETETQWFSSNVFEADGTSFPNTPQNLIFSVTHPSGKDVTVGMFGVTLDSNPVSYVSYTDPFEAAASHISALKDQVDILVAVTHLSMEQDMDLAAQFPDIDLIIGGHEHENAIEWHGPTRTPITKADANARTAYIIDMDFNHKTQQLDIKPRLQRVTSDIPDDPKTAKVVEFWRDKAFEGFESQGFEPLKNVTTVTDPLDGTEASVRTQPTLLTKLIAESMLHAAPGTSAAMFNGGSIRIDDTILPGPITEYDIIRIMPFGGSIESVEMTGELLMKTLEQGLQNSGIGGYLQTAGVEKSGNQWVIDGKPVTADGKYNIAINDFLLTGKEQDLEFLKDDNPGLRKLKSHDDLRKALIVELKKVYVSN